MRSNCEESMLLFEKRPAIWDWVEPYGMAKLSRPGLGRSMRLTWEYVSASVCSGSWAFGCASRAPVLLKPIRNGKRRIKKTPNADARRDRGSVGHGRSAFPAAWFPLPDVDSTGDQGSGFAARSHAEECGILRRGTVAGWKMSVLPGSRQVPWRDLLCVYEKPSPHPHPNRAPSGAEWLSSPTQREISSCPVAQGVERRARPR